MYTFYRMPCGDPVINRDSQWLRSNNTRPLRAVIGFEARVRFPNLTQDVFSTLSVNLSFFPSLFD